MERERGGRPRYPGILTPAEQRVLAELRKGGTNIEIAIRLGLSPETVKTHIASMLSKLELPNRHALARWQPREERARERMLRMLAVPAGVAAIGRPLLWAGAGLAGAAVVTVAAFFIAAALTNGDRHAAVPSDARLAAATSTPVPSPAPTRSPTAAPTPAAVPTPTAAAVPTGTPAATSSAEGGASPTPSPTASRPPPRDTWCSFPPEAPPDSDGSDTWEVGSGPSEVRAALDALPWIEDGVSDAEVGTVEILRHLAERAIAKEHCRMFLVVLGLPWVQDGLSSSEYTVIEYLLNLPAASEDERLELLAMPFLRTIEGADLAILEYLDRLPRENRMLLGELLDRPSLAGGITEQHEQAVGLYLLEVTAPEAHSALKALPWVSDGIDAPEAWAFRVLNEMARKSRPVFDTLVERSWLRDGLDRDETRAARDLAFMANTNYPSRDEHTAVLIAEMPFLAEAVREIDATAVFVLMRALGEGGSALLEEIVWHPRIDGAIAAEEAMRVASLNLLLAGRVHKTQPGLLSAILDPDRFALTTSQTETPHTGAVTTWVLRAGGHAPSAMAILQESLGAHEAFLAAPLPYRYPGLLVADLTPEEGLAGNFGMASVDPGLEDDRHAIAHEAAHIYWRHGPRWIYEGAAEFMAERFSGAQEEWRCSYDTLADLDEREEEVRRLREQGNVVLELQDDCPYGLGRDLFSDLYDTLGDEDFRQAFRRLYLAVSGDSQVEQAERRCTGAESGFCYVTHAFVTDASPESAALAEPVINQRYYGDPEGPASDR